MRLLSIIKINTEWHIAQIKWNQVKKMDLNNPCLKRIHHHLESFALRILSAINSTHRCFVLSRIRQNPRWVFSIFYFTCIRLMQLRSPLRFPLKFLLAISKHNTTSMSILLVDHATIDLSPRPALRVKEGDQEKLIPPGGNVKRSKLISNFLLINDQERRSSAPE